ncbi:TPA: outer membrane beta-barrel protein [Citrobacter werkmanii]
MDFLSPLLFSFGVSNLAIICYLISILIYIGQSVSTKYFTVGKFSCLTLLSLLSVIAQAHAASDGLYAGANIGWSQFDSNDFTRGHDRDSIGFSGFMGYQFTSWFSLEGGGSSLGSASGYKGLAMDVQGLTLSSKFSYPLAGVDLYSRLGGMWYRSDVSSNHINNSDVDTGVAPLAALGIEYSWDSNLTSRIEYQWTGQIKNDTATSATLNDSFVSVGMTWHFGDTDESLPAQNMPTVEKSALIDSEVVPVSSELAIFYSFNQSALSNDNQQKIIDFYHQRKSGGVTNFEVDGYSDIQGSKKNNLIVSRQRADNVKDFLLDTGISEKNIVVHAEGGTVKFNNSQPGPEHSFDQQEDYLLNRRVSIKMH